MQFFQYIFCPNELKYIKIFNSFPIHFYFLGSAALGVTIKAPTCHIRVLRRLHSL